MELLNFTDKILNWDQFKQCLSSYKPNNLFHLYTSYILFFIMFIIFVNVFLFLFKVKIYFVDYID